MPATTATGPVADLTQDQIDAEFSHIIRTNFSGQVSGTGVDEWPSVTVRNGSEYPIIATFSGHGAATDPGLPNFPTQMIWGVDDSPLDVAPGQTAGEDLGKQFGEVLAVFNGGQVTSFVVQVSVSFDNGDAFSPSDNGCLLPVTRVG